MVYRLYIRQSHIDEMVRHALEGRPEEVCGLLGGKALVRGEVGHSSGPNHLVVDAKAEQLYRAVNREHSPVRYEIDPHDLLRIFRDMERHDWELVGIYHSHTHTQAYPSATDVRLAFYPDAFYILVSLEDEARPQVRAYRIIDGKISEAELVVE